MKVWKLVVTQKVSLEAVEAALTAACTEITQEQHPEGAYGMLDMVGIRERETIIFISGNERTATIFSKMIEESRPKTKVILSSVPPSEIKKLVNQWFKSHTPKT